MIENTAVNWMEEICSRIRDYSEGDLWSDGAAEILCKTESAARAIADMLESLYGSQGEEVTVVYGYYDPEQDKREGTEDRYTGWWYVTID